ncbi:uncharacterized protein B0H18DRAFT_1185486 [Fomitopsis serialis]|uniref:uncharacterized protein n=1 Tax=Fomitopsis serialis TaxID=139415 RepID=UPI0020089D96|nr:uncharacterized protein B0H18DRAFT_1185486 [Neoantrodia serialis]KAH9922254.1 hypothetical protein B0H18DRAFT_1185486 [Neoantrodia serialis]
MDSRPPMQPDDDTHWQQPPNPNYPVAYWPHHVFTFIPSHAMPLPDPGMYPALPLPSHIGPISTAQLEPLPSAGLNTHTNPSQGTGRATQTKRSEDEKLEHMLAELKEINWTLSRFLNHLFRLKDDDQKPVHRSVSHGLTIRRFLSGQSKYKPIDIIDCWLHDPAGRPDPEVEDDKMYSLEKPFLEIPSARAALTSMVVQLCYRKLLKEMRSAVKGSSGLHGSQVGKRGHKELAWDDLGVQTIKAVRSIAEKHQPLTLQFLTMLASPEPHKRNGVVAVRKTRPPDLVAVEVTSLLNFSHTKFARLHASARAIMFFANGASRGIFNYGSRIAFSQSYTATYATLARMSAQRAEYLKKVGRDRRTGLAMRFDNVQQHTKERERRMGRENVMKIGVAGTVAEMFDYNPDVADVKTRMHLLNQNKRATLDVDSLFEVIDTGHLRQVFVMQWLQTLVNYVPELAHYKPKVSELFRTQASKFRVTDQKTIIHPLGTAAKNENITTELRDTMIDFLGQIGQCEDDYDHDRLIFVGGDGLTFERLLKLKEYMQFQDSAFKRFENVVPFLETWHTEWTYVNLMFETHWGHSLTNDPSKLGHSATKIDQKEPPNLKKVDYYSSIYVAYLVLDVRMLDCFRLHFETPDIFVYFKELASRDALPSLEYLYKTSETLYARYMSRRAYEVALTGDRVTETLGIPLSSEPWRDLGDASTSHAFTSGKSLLGNYNEQTEILHNT